ncbi:MAG: Gfo/Idh/MocA family oxidoreductase [Pseudomonadota bacterium]
MTSRLRAAVVGVGYFGRFHAKHYAAHPDADLVCVVDADIARARAVADEFGCDAIADVEALKDRVDLVSVAAPTSLHFQIVDHLLDLGLNVLVEKPITPDTVSADRLVAKAEARGLVLQVGHIERHSAVYKALRQDAVAPWLIEVRRHGPWRKRATDVDVVLDLMIHDLDLVLGLVDAPIAWVDAAAHSVFSDSEDMADARIAFANGTIANVSASRAAGATERRMIVHGGETVLVADFVESTLTRQILNRSAALNGGDALTSVTQPIEREDSLANEITEFLACVRTGGAPTVDGARGRDALDLARRVLDSARDKPNTHLFGAKAPRPEGAARVAE